MSATTSVAIWHFNMAHWPYDKYCSHRILAYFREEQLVDEWYIRCTLIFDPFLQIVRHENNVIHAPTKLREISFRLSFAKILLASFVDGGRIVFEARGKSAFRLVQEMRISETYAQ